MSSRLRAAAIGLLVLGGAAARDALAEAPAEPPVAAAAVAEDAAPAAKPARRRRRPMYEAVEKAVDEVMRRHYDPCAAAKATGLPCFPSSVDKAGPRYSVADAMRKYRPDGRRAEGAPITAAEMRQHGGGAPLSASGGASMDPVCTVKSLIRRISGNGKLYLYRLYDGRGSERPVLTDRKIEPSVYATNPEARYEYLGEYSGECEAIAAWRKALREAVAPAPVEDESSTAPAPPTASPAGDEVTVEDKPPGGARPR